MRTLSSRLVAGATVLLAVATVAGAAPALAVEEPGTGFISGTVTLPDGSPATDVDVTLFAVGDSDPEDPDSAVDVAFVDETGAYSFEEPEGDYLVAFSLDDTDAWSTQWYDGVATSEDAQTVSVVADEEVVADAALVEDDSRGTITGLVSDPGGAGIGSLEVLVYAEDGSGDFQQVDADDPYTGDHEVDAGAVDGRFTLSLRPGTYRLGFNTGPADGADESWRPQYYPNRSTLAAAGDLVVTAGSTLDVRATLLPALVESWGDPVIEGRVAANAVAHATTGEWSATGLTFTYQWLLDRRTIKGATRPTYVPKATAVGHRLAVRVTASYPGAGSESATSEARKVGKPAAVVTARAKAGKGKVVLTLKVGAAGIAAGKVKGTVKVLDGTRKVGTAPLSNGTGKVTVRLTRGTHTLTFRYAGGAVVAAGTRTLTVRVR